MKHQILKFRESNGFSLTEDPISFSIHLLLRRDGRYLIDSHLLLPDQFLNSSAGTHSHIRKIFVQTNIRHCFLLSFFSAHQLLILLKVKLQDNAFLCPAADIIPNDSAYSFE